MIETFKKLCWRFCILVEETYGISECLMTLHSLVRLPEDIADSHRQITSGVFSLREQLVDTLSSPVIIKVSRKPLHGRNHNVNSSKHGHNKTSN